MNYSFETGVYRPPSEGGSSSLLLRVTRNCPWNNCTFCGMYKGEKFSKRSPAEVKTDIDAIAGICRKLGALPSDGPDIPSEKKTVESLLREVPSLGASIGLGMVLEWIHSGMKTAFLQDANSLIIETDELVEILFYLRKTFPAIERVTSYARARTISKKSLEHLKAVKGAGLDRLHVGLETGDAELLKAIRKGAAPEDQVLAGIKAKEAGFQLSEYWMPGLGGKRFRKQHAENTAAVLNLINPHYIRSRPFFPHPGTPLYLAVEKGDWTLLSPLEQLLELKEMIGLLEVTSKVCFDHAGNYWPGFKGRPVFKHGYEGYQFPEKKSQVLELIAEGILFQERTPSGPPPWLSR
jgi:radical SAM superfamily enzyme YgiQ (UPF0313 family)